MLELNSGAGYSQALAPALPKKMTPGDVRRAASLLEQRRELHEMILNQYLTIDDLSKWLNEKVIIESARPALQAKVDEVTKELRELGVELDL